TSSCDRLLQRFSVLHHNHFFDAGKSHDRIVRNGHRHLCIVGDDFRVRKRTGTKLSIISDVGFNHQHAILLGDHWTESHDLAEIDNLIALDGYTNILTSAGGV